MVFNVVVEHYQIIIHQLMNIVVDHYHLKKLNHVIYIDVVSSFWRYTYLFIFEFDLAPTDCVVSQWSVWSSCTGCGQDAIQTRTRVAVRRARNGGKRCGPLKETKYCQTSVPC